VKVKVIEISDGTSSGRREMRERVESGLQK
jgi:hypothetical protein